MERIPVYLLDNGINRTAIPTQIVRESIINCGGLIVNDDPSNRWEALDKAILGMGIGSSPECLVDIGYLLGGRKPVAVFRDVFDRRYIKDEDRLIGLSIVTYSDPQDLADLVDKEFRNFREASGPLMDKYQRVPSLDYDELHIDLHTGQMRVGAEYLKPLPPKGFELIKALAMFRGCVLTIDEILQEAWGSKHFAPENVRSGVFRINKQIGRLTDGQYFIRNRYGLGYYLPLDKGVSLDPVAAEDLIKKREERGSWPLGMEIKIPHITNGELRIDFMQILCLAAGRPLALTVQEFRLLSVLALNRGRVVTNERLADNFIGSLARNAATLNSKIKEAGVGGKYITTLRGVGRMMPDYDCPESLIANLC